MTTPYSSEAFLHQLLGKALSANGSDVHLKVGQPPGARVGGDLVFFRVEKIRPEDTEAAARLLLGRAEGADLPEAGDMVFAYEAEGLGRFRVSLFRQRGAISLVMRSIPLQIPTLAELAVPAAVTGLAELPQGLVLVAGASGQGKSTTIAAMIGHLNQSYPKHVITLEDPIEHVFEDARASVSQREVGADVVSIAAGIEAALRQDPDVIVASDLRGPEALAAALDAAALGHLVIAAIAAPDVASVMSRLLGRERRASRVAAVLSGVLAQRLVPKRDGSGVVLATELLVASASVRDAIRRVGDGDVVAMLRDQMEKGVSPYGMQTFDMAMKQLVAQGIVSKSGGVP